MSQGSNRISNSIEMNAAVVELLEDVMKENDGKEGKENVIFGYLLDRVVNAPTMLHASGSVILLIPRLDELLNGTEESQK